MLVRCFSRVLYGVNCLLCNCINVSKKILLTSTSTGKSHNCLEIKILHFVLNQFYPKKVTSQPPCLILNIEGATDHSCLENHAVEQNKKMFTLHRCNFLNFQYNNISLQWLSSKSSSGHFDYLYTIIDGLQSIYL